MTPSTTRSAKSRSRTPPNSKPEVHRSDQQLGRKRGVGIRTQIASRDSPPDHARDLGASSGDHRRPKGVADRRVARDLREHRADDRAEVGLGQGSHRVGHRGEQLLAGVSGLGDRDVRPGELEEQVLGERLLGGPAAVDRGLAHAGPGGDVLEPQGREAPLDQQLARRGEDRLVGTLASRPSASRRGVTRWVRNHNRGALVFHDDAMIRNASYRCSENQE